MRTRSGPRASGRISQTNSNWSHAHPMVNGKQSRCGPRPCDLGKPQYDRRRGRTGKELKEQWTPPGVLTAPSGSNVVLAGTPLPGESALPWGGPPPPDEGKGETSPARPRKRASYGTASTEPPRSGKANTGHREDLTGPPQSRLYIYPYEILTKQLYLQKTEIQISMDLAERD